MSSKDPRHKARLCLCFRFKGKILKLAWINEDKKGVYVGVYGRGAGTHFSYHADGTTHFKGLNKALLFPAASQISIAAIPEMQQLTTMSVPLKEAPVARATHVFAKDPEGAVIFIGGHDDFVSYAHLDVTEFIINRSFEGIFAERIFAVYSCLSDATLIGFVAVPLAHFPDHKVALVVSAFR